MSCCRSTESPDLVRYRVIDSAMTALRTHLAEFKADTAHPVKADKLRRLYNLLHEVLNAD